jgi:hypothetical protein
MRLNLAQRIVVVIGLAGVLDVVRDWIVNRGTGDGWFNYAPNSGAAFPAGHAPSGGDHVVTIMFVVVWAIASAWLLRSHPER